MTLLSVQRQRCCLCAVLLLRSSIMVPRPELSLQAVCSRVVEVSAADGSIKRTLAEVPKEHTWDELRFNDGKVTPGGTYVLGRMHYEGPEGGPPGRLYTCAPLQTSCWRFCHVAMNASALAQAHGFCTPACHAGPRVCRAIWCQPRIRRCSHAGPHTGLNVN